MGNAVAKYQKYAEYKDSGVEWLGEIPSHWDLKASKLLFSIVNGSTPKSGVAEFWEGDITWVTPSDLSKITNFEISESLRTITKKGLDSCGTSLVPSGSLILSCRAPIGSLAITTKDVCTNQGCKSLVVKARVNTKFMYYFFSVSTEQLNILGRGTTFLELSSDELGNFKLPYPKINEQTAIANFLDHETAKIDSLIEKQQKLIELLKEKRQAVISHVVTKGLNHDVPMKDSGVEWLGQVPEHWTVSKLKHFVNVVDCKHITAEFFDEGIPLASIGEVKGWKVNLSKAKLTNEKYYFELIDGNRKPQVGDIIYTRNATVGEAALVHEELPRFALGQDVCLIHIVQKLYPEFLLHFLKSEIIKIQLNSAMVGSTFKRINVDDIRNYLVVIPPFDEQKEILKSLEINTKQYDSLISSAEKQINLMKERRTALISSAVTGKIDVRNWQNPNHNNNEAQMELSQ